MSKRPSIADVFTGNGVGMNEDGKFIKKTVTLLIPYITTAIELAEARGLAMDARYLEGQRIILQEALKAMDEVEHELHVEARNAARDRSGE